MHGGISMGGPPGATGPGFAGGAPGLAPDSGGAWQSSPTDPCKGMGVAGICLEPKEQMADSKYQYVGEGRGQYEQVPMYNYVGEGAGSFERDKLFDSTGAWRWRFQLICILTMALAIIAVLFSWVEQRQIAADQQPAAAGADATADALVQIPPLESAAPPPAPDAQQPAPDLQAPLALDPQEANSSAPQDEIPGADEGAAASGQFDCDEGYAAWETSWDAVKQSWCCTNKKRGCLASEPAPAEEWYDCIAGFHHWKKAWDPEQKAWCCKEKGKGCEEPSTTAAAEGTSTEGQEAAKEAFQAAAQEDEPEPQDAWDCEGHDFTSWDKETRIWCCTQEDKGCPDMPGSITTTQEQPQAPDASGGDIGAAEDAPPAALESATTTKAPPPPSKWPSKPVLTPPPPPPPPTQPELAGQGAPDNQLLPAGSPSAPAAAGCSAMCTFNSKSFTCQDRILHTATHRAAGSQNACVEARDLVLEDCPGCSSCPLASTSCKDAATAAAPPAQPAPPPAAVADIQPLTLPQEGGAAPGAQLTDEDVVNAAASGAAPAAAAPAAASGAADAAELPPGGTAEPPPEPPADAEYDCEAEPEEEWSQEKSGWCCQNQGTGCGSATPAAAGTEEKKGGFDCSEGLFDWQRQWTPAKKLWCCEHETLACPESETTEVSSAR